MLTEPVRKQAQSLFKSHRESDQGIENFIVLAVPHAVWILEVSGSVEPVHEVIPFRFARNPATGLDLDTTIALISPEEYRMIIEGELDLPEGWELEGSVDLAGDLS